MTCRLCESDKPVEAFQANRKVCRSCRATKQRNTVTARANSLRAWRKKYSLNKEEWNERQREYRKKRALEGRPIQRNCKSDKYRKSGRLKFFIRAEVFRLKGSLCQYCNNPADQIDHVVALARGGTDDLSNLVPACKSCNSSKQAKPVQQWLAERKVG